MKKSNCCCDWEDGMFCVDCIDELNLPPWILNIVGGKMDKKDNHPLHGLSDNIVDGEEDINKIISEDLWDKL